MGFEQIYTVIRGRWSRFKIEIHFVIYPKYVVKAFFSNGMQIMLGV